MPGIDEPCFLKVLKSYRHARPPDTDSLGDSFVRQGNVDFSNSVMDHEHPPCDTPSNIEFFALQKAVCATC